MSIIRVKKEEKYFIAANAPFQDKNLSWEARGAMGYLLSKPDGWQCRNYDLVNQGPAGEHTIKRIMKELREAGYVHRFKVSQGRGKIEWVTEVYESPDLNPNFTTGDFTTVVNTTGDTIEVEKSTDIVSTDSQKVLTKENTDLNANSKNSLETKINALANAIAKIANTNDQDTKAIVSLALKICTVCGLDIMTVVSRNTQKDLIAVSIALCSKPNIEAKLKAFNVWWYKTIWIGKQGQPPTPSQLGDTWGQFEADKVSPAANGSGPSLTDAEKARLAELVAENQTK